MAIRAEIVAKWAGGLGGVLAMASLFLYLIRPDQTVAISVLLAAAAILLAAFFVVHFEAFKSVSRRRTTRLGANSLLMVVLFLGILAAVNFLLARHPIRTDLTESGRFSLAPQTVNVLQALEQKVRVTAFYQEGTRGHSQMRDLLESYRYHSRNLSYEFVDPAKRPAIAKQYGITQYETSVIEGEGQEARIRAGTEQELTNAIIRATRARKKVATFLEGHGERRVDDQDTGGYSLVKDALEKEGYETPSLLLLQQEAVPRSTTLLLVGGPTRPLLPQETDAIEQYLKGGGQVFLMIDPQTQTGLEPLLSAWGVVLGENFIVDPLSRLLGADYTVPVVSQYPSPEVTQDFQLATFFPFARTVSFDQSKAEETEYASLAETGPNSWAETDFQLFRTSRTARLDPGEDQQGPLTVGAVFQAKGDENGKGRLVVFGDADFATNGYLNFSGNRDLFLNIVNWLAQEEDLISIRPKEARGSVLFLTATQGKVIFYLPVVILPTLVLGVGLVVWQRRRRL